MTKHPILVLLAAGAAWLPAQEKPARPQVPFDQAAAAMQPQLEQSLAELKALYEQMVAEKAPLHKRLGELQNELLAVRAEYQNRSRLLETRTLDVANLRTEIKSRHEEASYLANLLGEYERNFESRVHIAEKRRYDVQLAAARLAPENTNLAQRLIYAAQTDLLATALTRLEEALGGTRFQGTAVDERAGLVVDGTFVVVGPVALFRSADGATVGPVEQRVNSNEPTVVVFENPADTAAAAALVESGEGVLPFDPTLGNAHKVEGIKETLWEHIRAGGPVMVPIFVLAGAALLVVLYKWLTLLFVRKPSPRRVQELLTAVAGRDREAVKARAAAIGGPTGRMLAVGVEHLDEPRELIEEVMYESVLGTKLRLNRLLPFVAISAASAPLLGLLGTVTGIMNTFKLITVFGTGDVKTLSSGISEALITTEYGLMVAIPSLLIHALLSRKARGVVDQMEKVAVAFLNQVSVTALRAGAVSELRRADPAAELVGAVADRNGNDPGAGRRGVVA